jgi:large repetitive protein
MKNTFTLILFMLLFSLPTFAQLDEEGFEGTWTVQTGTGAGGPADWAVANVLPYGPVQTWSHGNGGTTTPVYEGDYSATILGENVQNGFTSEDWLITKAFTVPANAELHFFSRLGVAGDQGTSYKIMMSANTTSGEQTNMANYAAIQTWTELTLNPSQTDWTEKVVTIPATYPQGTTVFLAFVMQGDNGDRWAIDNVKVVSKCLDPTTLTAVPSGTTANLSWANPSGATAWEIEIVPAAGSPTGSGTVYNGALPYTAPGLTPNTAYKYYVRALCDDNTSNWVGPFTFTTTQIPAALPLSENWETTTASDWALSNGTLTNKWVIGTAASSSATHSLYISNDNGVNNSYSNTSPTLVYAYRDIQLPTAVDQLSISYDWRNVGESGWDYARIWLVPTTYTLTPSTTYTAQITAATDRIQVGPTMVSQSSWQTASQLVTVPASYAGQIVRLVVEWRSDTTIGSNPGAAVDNINVSVVTCPPPTGLAISNLTNTTATYTWNSPTSVSPSYDYYIANTNTAPVATTTPTGNVTTPTFQQTPLTAGTTYYFWVRSNCSATDQSPWVGPVSFTTPQDPATLNYSQNFDTAATANDWALVNGNQTNKWVVGSAVSNSPSSSLYISNDNGATNNYTITSTSVSHAYRDIMIPAGADEINLSFDWKSYGQSATDYLRVWFVPVTYTPTAGTQTTTALAGSTGVQVGGNFQLSNTWANYNYTLNVGNYDGTMRRVVFEWRNNAATGTQSPAAIDNIIINVVTCPQPLSLTATNVTSTTAQLNWTNQGAADQWEVYVVPTGTTAPTATTTGTITDQNPYTVTALNSATTYQFYVRAICSDTDKSIWSGPTSFTTAIANDSCEGATEIPVNPGEDCIESVSAVFTGATSSATPACTGTNGPDIWYTFTAEDTQHNISADFSNMAVSALENTTQPITLSLYAGNVCTALDAPLYCSTNNYIQASNLTIGSQYTVRVTISSTSPNLSYPFTMCVTTPVNNSGSASTCEINTINYSFESPNLPDAQFYPPMVNQNVVPGWKTTATDGKIEIWHTFPTGPSFEGYTAYEGDQFIELNANQVSAVYQDYQTPPGTVFSYGFAHRARTTGTGQDVCQLMAGPPGGPYTNVGPQVASGSAAWTYNTGSYTVPAGQTVTRFLFQSVSSASGNNTIGNFLDAISFTANVGIITNSPVALDCQNNTALIEANGVGTWVAHSGNPAPTVIEDDQNNSTTVSGFTVAGSYYYDWSTELCSSTIEIVYAPDAISEPVVVDVTYCQNDIPAPLTATAETGNTLHWFTDATGGTELTEAPTPTTDTAGTTTYYVSQSFYACESPRAAINVTVNPLPAAPVVTDVEYCQNATAAPLTATADTGSTLVWYTVANGGTALTEAPTPVTTATGSAIYYVSQQNAQGCEGARAAITVTVNPLITPGTSFTLPATVCELSGTIAPTQGEGFVMGGTYSAGEGLSIDSSTGFIDLTESTPGDYTVTYAIAADADNCIVAASSQATITITAATTPEVGFTYTDVCSNAANQTPATATGFVTGGTFSATAGLDINAATGEINVANSTPGSYIITYTLEQNSTSCIAAATSTAPIVITAVFAPVAEFSYNDNYCYGQGTVFPSFAADFTAGGTFTATNGLTIDASTGAINVDNATPGVYTVTYTVAPDVSICSAGSTFTDTFSIGGEIAFTLEGNCEGTDYYIRATSTVNNGEFADGLSFEWSTTDGFPVGGDNDFFNVSEWATGDQTFPMQFILTVTDGICENAVVFEVPDIACTVQRGISPNGDDKNQTFDLTSMGIKKLVIFNRYGKEVYSKTNYSNEWYGQTNNGEELPTGTYYYMFERNTGETRTGWIYINRED